MKKFLFLSIFFISSLFGESLFTLDGVKNLNFYLANKTTFLGAKEKKEIESLVKEELEENGFTFGEVDAIILVLAISSKEVEERQVVNIDFILAEEVTAHREEDVKTFANTYQMSELIATDEAYEETLEMIKIMLHQFIKSHKEDNK